jgi:hypothetical protein
MLRRKRPQQLRGRAQMASQHTQHIQKALDQMNLQIHHALREITGWSGLRILDAILAGDRDRVVLAKLCNWRVRTSRDIVAKPLEGDYRPEHVFTLRQSLAGYRYYQNLIGEVDEELKSPQSGASACSRGIARSFVWKRARGGIGSDLIRRLRDDTDERTCAGGHAVRASQCRTEMRHV